MLAKVARPSWRDATQDRRLATLVGSASLVTSIHLGNIAFFQDDHYTNAIFLCDFTRNDFQHLRCQIPCVNTFHSGRLL